MSEGGGAGGDGVAGEDGETLGSVELRSVKAELCGEGVIDADQFRRGHGRRRLAGEKVGGEAGVSVVEINLHARDVLSHFEQIANRGGVGRVERQGFLNHDLPSVKPRWA